MLHSSLLKRQGGIIHAFTTKLTPGTTHLYTLGDEASQAKTKQEAEQNVLALKAALKADRSASVALLKQIHSDIIVTIDSAPETAAWPVADALITKTTNLVIGVQTADCIPLLIYEPEVRVVAAVHGGWRGVAENIVEKTVAELVNQGARPGKMIAALGPSIQQSSYEVGEEVKSKLLQLGDYGKHFATVSNNKYLLDLPGIVKTQLTKIGIKAIDDLQLDTYTSPEFFSHRAYTHGKSQQVGRMVALISLC